MLEGDEFTEAQVAPNITRMGSSHCSGISSTITLSVSGVRSGRSGSFTDPAPPIWHGFEPISPSFTAVARIERRRV